jgi:hypothetical protein
MQTIIFTCGVLSGACLCIQDTLTANLSANLAAPSAALTLSANLVAPFAAAGRDVGCPCVASWSSRAVEGVGWCAWGERNHGRVQGQGVGDW